MGRIVITEYISVDGVVEAPSGTEDFARVGWIDDFRRGPEGDRFKFDETMASDALLFGRVTYDGFAPVWPHSRIRSGTTRRSCGATSSRRWGGSGRSTTATSPSTAVRSSPRH